MNNKHYLPEIFSRTILRLSNKILKINAHICPGMNAFEVKEVSDMLIEVAKKLKNVTNQSRDPALLTEQENIDLSWHEWIVWRDKMEAKFKQSVLQEEKI